MDIAQRLRDLRKDREVTQEQIAELLDVDESHISNVERSKKDMPLKKVEKWAAYLGARLAVLPSDAVVPEEVAALSSGHLELVLRLARVLPHVPPEALFTFEDAVAGLERRYSGTAAPISHEMRAKSS